MRRWYVTLQIQMAIDADGNMERHELEAKLGKVEVENRFDRSITFYTPDQTDVTYLEPDDA